MPFAASAGEKPLEREVGLSLEVRVHRAERLADEVDRRDAHELDVRVEQEAPDELGAAVTAPADDRRARFAMRASLPLERGIDSNPTCRLYALQRRTWC